MSRPWMPLYVADYLADTAHLSAAESGAYLHLIMHYWANGGLPVDDKKLARIAKMTAGEWDEARETIAEFFADGWKHGRIEKELAEANASYERRANAGRKGGLASRKPEQPESNASSIAPSLPEQSQPQSQSHNTPRSSSHNRERGIGRARAKIEFAIGMEIDPDSRFLGESFGLKDEALDAEWRRFVAKKAEKGATVENVSAAFAAWCENIATYGPARRIAPAAGGTPTDKTTIRIEQHTPQGRAWEAFTREKRRRGVPWTNGAWHFPSEWPPGMSPPAETHEHAA